MSEYLLGKIANWDAVVLQANRHPMTHLVTRRGRIVDARPPEHNGGTRVAVELSVDIDPHCPPEDDGKFLWLNTYAWKLEHD